MRLEEAQGLSGDHSGRLHQVIDFNLAVQRYVESFKESSIDRQQTLAELEAMVVPESFSYTGTFRETKPWSSWIAFLSRWGPEAEWGGSFRRISESDDAVFLEMEERIGSGERLVIANSLTVYEFHPDGRIVHVEAYMQMAVPRPEDIQHLTSLDFWS